jgi:hypothetical protein
VGKPGEDEAPAEPARADASPVAARSYTPAPQPTPDDLPGSEPDVAIPVYDDTPPPPPARRPGELVRRELSVDERARIERDPVVRQALELFNGIVIDVRAPLSAPAPSTAE